MNLGREIFNLFLTSDDTLWVGKNDSIIYRSQKRGIEPLVEYIEKFGNTNHDVTVFDRIVGNAAALLLTKASCQTLFSRTVSEHALPTLNTSGIDYFHLERVPHIVNRRGDGMCPFEEASIGKSAEEFFAFLKRSNKFKLFTSS
jgi:hypothetical protein